MIAARAIVTEHGGSTSHAAVVSRALGRPCVVGIGDSSGMRIGESGTVDGGAGAVYAGSLAVLAPREEQYASLTRMIGWARARSKVKVLRFEEGADVRDCAEIDAQAIASAAELPARLAGFTAARGSVLATPANARRMVELGIKTIVTEPVLPALLAVMRLE
jgi:pyruvate,orthophosphate dikinase